MDAASNKVCWPQGDLLRRLPIDTVLAKNPSEVRGGAFELIVRSNTNQMCLYDASGDCKLSG